MDKETLRLHESISKDDNQFKLYVLQKLDTIEKNHASLDKSFSIFKIKAFAFVAILVSTKELFIKYILKS